MPNLRIVSDNAADRGAVSASSTNGALAASRLLTERKSDVWQSAAGVTSARITETWTVAELIQAVAFPFCNFSPTCTWRVRLTNEASATNLFTYSEGAASTLSSSSHATDAGGFGNFAASISIQLVAGSPSWAYRAAVVPSGKTAALSVFVMMDDAGAPVVSTSTTTGDFSLVMNDTQLTTAATVQNFGGGIYRISGAVAGAGASRGFGVVKYAAQSARGFRVTGYQLETTAVSSYYPTTAAAATRPLGYIDTWQSYTYDSGSVLACPAPAVFVRGFTAAQAASAYAYGGGSIARLWMPSAVSAYGMAIDIVDTNNLQGHLEAARLVCGPYWSPTYNTSELSATNVDTTQIGYTEAGDQWADAGPTRKKVPISLEYMPESDRVALGDILRGSRAYPIFLSVFPESANLSLERSYSVYGRRMSDSEVATQAAIMYGTKIDVESV